MRRDPLFAQFGPAAGRYTRCVTSSDKERSCPECGARLDGSNECAACGSATPGIELKVLPRLDRGEFGGAPPEVRLVRELKVPTVEDLLADSDLDTLPGAMRAVEDAIDAGELQEADRRLDAALGSILSGPGYRPDADPWGVVPLVLWVWAVILVLLFLLSLLL
ncbi:MAG: hypothetical protein H6837_06565 [Planctomycetes bacterium]|nr:hypothetical protein [Planctomycetota bacterium]